MKTKKCATCGEDKLIDCFSHDKNEKDGYKRYCKECISQKTADYRKRNLGQINERKRASYHRSKLWAEERTRKQMEEKVRTCSLCGETKPLDEFYVCGNGGFRTYCKNCANISASKYRNSHREAILARKREYNSEHKIEIGDYNHKYYLAHCEEVKDRVRNWAAENRDRVRDNEVICAQRKRSAANELDSLFTREDWDFCRNFFSKDGETRCAYCGKPVKRPSQDHVIPVSSGGSYTVKNILPVCSSCNSSKGARDFSEWYCKQSFYSSEKEKRIEEYFSMAGKYRED